MLITLCYVYLWLRYQRCYTQVIRGAVRRLCGSEGRGGLALCTAQPGQQYRRPGVNKRSEEPVFLRLGNKVIYITEEQACEDISKWIRSLGSSVIPKSKQDSVAFVIEATEGQELGVKHLCSPKKGLKWSDYCLPLAYSPGLPFRAVAEATVDNFSCLAVAFMENQLQMDNGLVPEKIVSVLLRDSALKKVVEAELPESENLRDAVLHNPSDEIKPPSCERTVQTEAAVASGNADGDCLSHYTFPLPAPKLEDLRGHHMEGHHLHLSSCHECLELENSTIQSVKFASAENIPDLPDDCGVEGAEEVHGLQAKSSGKPPNVLVFTGDSEECFQSIHSLLCDCIDTESYTIYPLSPQQALTEPWQDNAFLLVLATPETLPPMLQDQIMSYLQRGGRLLGLCSSYCPTGLSLGPRRAQGGSVCRMLFTRPDTTEVVLSVLSGDYMFQGTLGEQQDEHVEVWGQLQGDCNDTVIVKVTHGQEGGKAVLCQVRLEMAPNTQNQKEFDELKMSNKARYEVLSDILSSLGLSCEVREVPPPSPVYLLCTTPESRDTFLTWLKTQVDTEGLIKSSKTRLKVLHCAEPQMKLPQGLLSLVTEPPEHVSEHFSLETYSHHLHTRVLGHCLLFTEVTPTTMDLLEGMMLQLPEEVGLIAIASRQTKGRGRGGNAWLSPLGCAMFTLHQRVPISSRLGQRIPFLQHLVALAVVESVRTLPGYEDIDLRVKWPNDIYYSDLMKLGGVLVNSTVMGSNFHLLIGCAFNVSNSNPTICINDLLVQHNRQWSSCLESLSTSQLIARTLTVLEQLLSTFEERGPQAVLPLYYKRWVHSGTEVRLWSENGPKAAVVGLDDNGFLQVRSEDQGVVSVQPDGNSFDMLRNLIITKRQ